MCIVVKRSSLLLMKSAIPLVLHRDGSFISYGFNILRQWLAARISRSCRTLGWSIAAVHALEPTVNFKNVNTCDHRQYAICAGVAFMFNGQGLCVSDPRLWTRTVRFDITFCSRRIFRTSAKITVPILKKPFRRQMKAKRIDFLIYASRLKSTYREELS